MVQNAKISFKVGDLVSRDGTDRQKILEINDAGDLIHVECIGEPSWPEGDPWCKLGDREWNVPWRYEHAGDIIEGRQR